MQDSEVWLLIITFFSASTAVSFVVLCARVMVKLGLCCRPRAAPAAPDCLVPLVLKKVSSDCYMPLVQVKPSSTPLWTGHTLTVGGFSLGTCFICCEASATVVMLNCGHSGLCLACAEHLYLEKALKCSFCRAPIVSMAHGVHFIAEEEVLAVLCTTATV